MPLVRAAGDGAQHKIGAPEGQARAIHKVRHKVRHKNTHNRKQYDLNVFVGPSTAHANIPRYGVTFSVALCVALRVALCVALCAALCA